MQKDLPPLQIAWIYLAAEPLFVDPGNLMGEESRMSFVVVDACRAQQDVFFVCLLFAQHRLGSHLRGTIGQLRSKRVVFRDRPARLCRRVRQHRRGENELFEIEFLQTLQKPFGALHRHRFVG